MLISIARNCSVVVTSDSETRTVGEESSELEISDDKTCRVKLIQSQGIRPSLEPQV